MVSVGGRSAEDVHGSPALRRCGPFGRGSRFRRASKLAALVALFGGGGFWIVAGNRAVAHHPHDTADVVAVNQDGTVFCASDGTLNAFLKSTDGGRSWKESRYGLAGRSISALEFAADWSKSGVIYAAPASGGLQRSTDRGESWSPPMFRGKFEHLAVDPSSPGGFQIYAATVSSIVLSRDGGASAVVVLQLSPERMIRRLLVSPTFERDHTVVAAISDSTLEISSNGGRTWARRAVGHEPWAVALSPRYFQDKRMWVATSTGGVLAWNPRLSVFEPVNEGLGQLMVNDLVIDMARPSRAWAVCDSAGLYWRSAADSAWNRASLDPKLDHLASSHYWNVNVARREDQSALLYCGMHEGLFISSDEGQTWGQAMLNPTRFGRLLEISPNFETDRTVIGGGYGMHLMVSEDRAGTWETRFDDFFDISVHGLGISPDFAADSLVLAGVRSGLRLSRDAGRTYSQIILDPPDSLSLSFFAVKSFAFSPEFARDQTVFAVTGPGLYRSTNGGDNWAVRLAPFKGTYEIAISPGFPADSVLYASGPITPGIYLSTDAGNSWNEVGNLREKVRTVVLSSDFVESGELFAIGANRGLLRSLDRGNTWEVLDGGFGGGLPACIALPKSYRQTGVAVVATESHGVFETRDFGQNWTSISANARAVDNALSLVISPNYPEDPLIVVGNWNGFVRTTDRGTTWEVTTQFEIYDEQREDPWLVSGNWHPGLALPGSINFGVAVSNEKWARFTLPFQGRGVTFLGATGPEHGLARFIIDGVVADTVDTWSAETMPQQVLWSVKDLAPGLHYATLEVLGERGPNASGAIVALDAAEVMVTAP